MVLLSSNKVINLIVTAVILGTIPFLMFMVSIDEKVSSSAGEKLSPLHLSRIPNLHRPVFQSSLSRKLTVLVVPHLQNHALPYMAPVKKRIDQRISVDSKKRERLPGFYRGSFRGSVLKDELLFTFATGYSFGSLHYGPLSLSLGKHDAEEIGPSFLSEAGRSGYRVFLCGNAMVHRFFQEKNFRREFTGNDTTFIKEAPAVLTSSYASLRSSKSVHIVVLEPSESLPDKKSVDSLLEVALTQTDRDKGLLLVLGLNYGSRPGQVTDHDFFFYGDGVIHQKSQNSHELEMSDIVSTISCQLRLSQPSVCIGWPLCDLMNVYSGQRRLWLTSQISQENERMIPMVVATYFGRRSYKIPPLRKVEVITSAEESEYIALRQTSLGRTSRKKAISKEVRKYTGYSKTANIILLDDLFWWFFVVCSIVVVVGVLLFGPSVYQLVFFGIFFNVWLYVVTEYLFDVSPELPFFLMSGKYFSWEVGVLFSVPVLLWSLLGIRYQWNGRNSTKVFLIVGLVSILTGPVNYIINLFVTADGITLQTPVSWVYPLWIWRVYSLGLIVFSLSALIFPATLSFAARGFTQVYRRKQNDSDTPKKAK